MHDVVISLLVLSVNKTFYAGDAVFLFPWSDAQPSDVAVDPNSGLLSTR